jgi:hypothetical protein
MITHPLHVVRMNLPVSSATFEEYIATHDCE